MNDHRQYYALTPTRRPAHAVVRLEVGQGTTVAGVSAALKQFKRRAIDSGLVAKFNHRSGRLRFVPPSERRRMKALAARARERKAGLKSREHEARADERQRARKHA